MKQFGLTETKLLNIFIGYLKTGVGVGEGATGHALLCSRTCIGDSEINIVCVSHFQSSGPRF